jgi:hypothetical protein
MGLLEFFAIAIIGFLVFIGLVIGGVYLLLRIYFPAAANAIGSFVSAFFSGASSNSSFSSADLNFTYSGNWIQFAPSTLMDFFGSNNSILHTNLTQNASMPVALVPSSLISYAILNLPSVISSIRNGSLSYTLGSFLNQFSIIVVYRAVSENASIPLLSNISLSNSASFSGLSMKVSSRFPSAVIKMINLSGAPGVLFVIRNYTLSALQNISLIETAVSRINDTLCLVVGVSVSELQVHQENSTFARVIDSVTCKG